MKRLSSLILILSLLFMAPQAVRTWWLERSLKKNVSVAETQRSGDENQSSYQAGRVEVKGVAEYLTEDLIHHHVSLQSLKRQAQVYFWNWGGVTNATASAHGLDRRHHFVNSYLVGFLPFKTNLAWIPLYTLAMRKHYQYDHLQYSDLQDVWQNSRQAFYYTRGDCEDHAIILADWLINLGFHARVVLGKFKGEGHAWVVLFRNNNTYLLEATDKSKQRGMDRFLLANMATDYQPEYQFDHEHFWVNTRSVMTTRYSGDHWQLRSRFVRSEGNMQRGS